MIKRETLLYIMIIACLLVTGFGITQIVIMSAAQQQYKRDLKLLELKLDSIIHAGKQSIDSILDMRKRQLKDKEPPIVQ